MSDDHFGLLKATSRSGSILDTGNDVYEAFVRARVWWRGKTDWTVTVQSGDRLYEAALKWLFSDGSAGKPPRQVKAVLQRAGYGRFSDLDAVGIGSLKSQPATVGLLYDERGARTVTIEGHRIRLAVHKVQLMGGSGPEASYRPTEPDALHFHARSRDGQQAVVRLLENLATDQQKAKPSLYLLSNWGDWDRRDDLPQRQLDSVVLAEGQMERLRDDIQDFLSSENDYTRRGMPYHRGYLLYGPPGTGKTSIVRALAAHFGLDLWYVPLGDLQKDGNLLTLINQVRPGSILLLEDVDVFAASQDRAQQDGSGDGNVSLAGLLNALDGVATPHGLITFLTTNDRSVMDSALLRPGRVDLQEKVGLPDRGQIVRLYESWFDTSLSTAQAMRVRFKGSTAEVVEVLKRNMNDGPAALAALQQPPVTVEKPSVPDVTPLQEKRDERNGRTGRKSGTRSRPLAEAKEGGSED